MPIVMTDYKMVYKDQVFNALSIRPIVDSNLKNGKRIVNFIEAMYINEDGEVEIIEDEAWCFKFVRR
ncbi:hypothetical protein [Anaerocolumna chitinilytica]|uniref:Uncharacterized protein n=1 Tax=Anaerocolumna chitinilytica TaxID=1727145 RepID=A0A7M3SA08_9FIRM|nr:hypothetical protein [Anaerocolumna chitinilytica]BCK01426.1 hypothetical protein bsdcttw_44660 [Anaerocolumna chitinilytica]